jgi:hypothetical protein
MQDGMHDDAVTMLERCNAGADGVRHAGAFVPEDAPRSTCHDVALEDVEIGT